MMSEKEYREKADELLMLLQSGKISYQEYTRQQHDLVNNFYESRLKE